MNTLVRFLTNLGGLHDAVVTSIIWRPIARSIEFTFDDLYANFRGLPEDTGTQQGRIVLHGVSGVLVEVDLSERLRVFEFLPDGEDPNSVVLRFSPSGRITVKFETAEHAEKSKAIEELFMKADLICGIGTDEGCVAWQPMASTSVPA